MCMTAMIALSVAQGAMAVQQANAAADRAAQQAQDEYAAADANLKAQYAESNRKQAEAAIDNMNEQSDRIRAANEHIGTMRATETALSDASLTSILFENAYGDALNYTRIDENFNREFAALDSEKSGAQQSYLNTVTQAKNQANNAIAQANAQATGAVLNAAGTSLNIYNTDQNQQKILTALNPPAK